MEKIIYTQGYKTLRDSLKEELSKSVESFVRIGYLLKVARDTDVLKESEYKTVTEFAEVEYGLNATQVSRFISINDRFAEGGYSDRLDTKYQGFGYAKLSVMLQLPDTMNEELSPSMSKREIETVKAEFDAEAKVTDIERVLEGSNSLEGDTSELDDHTQLLYQTILALGEAEPELYERVAAVDGYEEEEEILKALPLIMVPSDTKVYSIRVIGKGRMMLTCTEDKASIVNSRTGEKEIYTWAEVAAAWEYAGAIEKLPFPNTTIGKWEKRYEKKWPIAPVQEPKSESKPEKLKKPKKESKVVKAKPDDDAEHIEEQVEGQLSFEEACPEIIPQDYENNSQEHEGESHESEAGEPDTQVVGEVAAASKYPESVEYERREVLDLLDGLRAEVCKEDIKCNGIRELKNNMIQLIASGLENLAMALWEYEIELPDEEDEDD
ncbi:MAG: hypothetical protein E7273_12375 [Pseudobutyrivibrio ruminis]|nr:hypothetical protein [Pseudobutyrivibrio ruminis]